MLLNTRIYGLVTRSSSDKRMPLKPLRCAGLYKTEGARVSGPEVVTKPSPYTSGAFCLAITQTPQSGLANGPKWAALKKHRLPRKGKLERLGALQGACVVGRTAEFTNEPSKAEVGWQGRASGLSQPLSKSSGFDKVFQVSGSLFNRKAGEGSANPCIRRPMTKNKEGKNE